MIRAVLLSLSLLASCTDVPLATQAALGEVDPLSADPAGFVLFLSLPPGIGLRESSGVMTLTAERSDTEARIDGSYRLEAIAMGPEGMLAFRVAPGDLERLRADQATAAAWETEVPELSSGALSISAAGCLTGAPVPEDARVSARLRIAEGGPTLPVLRDAPLRRLLGEEMPQDPAATCDATIH